MALLYDLFGPDGSLTGDGPAPEPTESLADHVLVGPTNWEADPARVCVQRDGEWCWETVADQREARWWTGRSQAPAQ